MQPFIWQTKSLNLMPKYLIMRVHAVLTVKVDVFIKLYQSHKKGYIIIIWTKWQSFFTQVSKIRDRRGMEFIFSEFVRWNFIWNKTWGHPVRSIMIMYFCSFCLKISYYTVIIPHFLVHYRSGKTSTPIFLQEETMFVGSIFFCFQHGI